MKKRSKRTAKQTLVLHIMYGVCTVLLVVGIGWGTHYVTHMPSQQITTITVAEGETVPSELVASVVTEALSGDYIGLIPKENKFLWPEKSISASIDAIPKIKDVVLAQVDQTLEISFTEYEPFALWCQPDNARCLLVDATGFAYMEAPRLDGGSLYRFVVANSVLLVDTHMLESSELQRAVSFSEALAANFGFEVHTISYENDTDIYYTFEDGSQLRTNIGMSNDDLVGNLQTLFTTEAFTHLATEPFEYIDLRFGNKVYVNEKEEEVIEPETETATSSDEMAGEDLSDS